MQSSIIIRPNPPFPNDMALILFCKLIRKLCFVINGQPKDDVAIDVEEKIKHLKKMLNKNIITEEQYSSAVEMLLEEYITVAMKSEKRPFAHEKIRKTLWPAFATT